MYFVTWGIAIVGWYISNRNNNLREDRKEQLSSIETLKDDAYELEGLAVEYHTSSSRNKELEKQIKLKIQRLNQRIEIHQLLNNNSQKCVIKSLRKSITLDNFDTDSHYALTIDHKVIRCINNAVNDMVDISEQTFRERYPLITR